MGKYENEARELLTLIGGKENIAAVFTLHDENAICIERAWKSRCS